MRFAVRSLGGRGERLLRHRHGESPRPDGPGREEAPRTTPASYRTCNTWSRPKGCARPRGMCPRRGLPYVPTVEGTGRREHRRPRIVGTLTSDCRTVRVTRRTSAEEYNAGLRRGSCRSDRTGKRPRARVRGPAFVPRGMRFGGVPRALEGSPDDVGGVEVLGGEVDDPIGIERFARIDIDREEPHGLVPGVEVGA